jgi:hypothetical protein
VRGLLLGFAINFPCQKASPPRRRRDTTQRARNQANSFVSPAVQNPNTENTARQSRNQMQILDMSC